MLNKFFGFFILGLFSLFSVSYTLAPVFLILELVTFGLGITIQNVQNAIFVSIFCGSALVIITTCKNILFFYVSFFIRRKAKKFINYTSTQYSKMLDILKEESFRRIHFSPMKIQILIDEDFKPKVYSFGSAGRGFVVFSLGMLDEIVRLVKEDSNKALDAFKSLIAHEVAHLKNYDFINYDFYHSQARLSSVIIESYVGIFKILKFLFIMLPIPFIRNWIKSFFEFILINPIRLALSAPLFLMKKLNTLLRKTLFQINETEADVIAVKIFGIKYFELCLNKLPQFSSAFSLHQKTAEQRIAKVSSVEKSAFEFDNDYRDIFILANLLVLLLMALCAMIAFFFINSEEVFFIQSHLKQTLLELKNSENKIILTLTNIKSLFF